MVEFYGELSDDCKRFILKKLYRISLLSAILAFLCLATPLIVATIVWNYLAIYFLPFVGLIILVCILVALPKTNPQEKVLKSNISIRITIQGETIERFGVGSGSYSVKNINDVKNVIDMGRWYVINFYFPEKNLFFLCEKDLIVEGSLKEFEALFADKLVKKIK